MGEKASLPPGTLVHVGQPKNERTTIDFYNYEAEIFQHRQDVAPTDLETLRTIQGVKWIKVEGVHDLAVIQEVGRIFGLHPLVLEDVVNTMHRPKLEDYADYLFIVLRMLHFNRTRIVLEQEQLSLVLGKGYVITFSESGKPDLLAPVVERITSGQGRIRRMGADYLAYALIDSVVDAYFSLIDEAGEVLDIVEEKVLADPTRGPLQSLYKLKRANLTLRKAIWPLREVVGPLARGYSELTTESITPYLRDVEDHVVHVMEAADTLRETQGMLLDIYLSSVNNRLNEVMKLLTIIATIFIPLTFLAGVYGMNFKYMPELQWQWGYPAVLAVMFGAAMTMLILFRRKKWL
jgi:magnesium transporter